MDKESIKFIAWVNRNWANSMFREQLYIKVRARFEAFLNLPPEDILKSLDEKLALGAKQYGSPIYTKEKTTFELSLEHLDMFGWELIEMWNEQ